MAVDPRTRDAGSGGMAFAALMAGPIGRGARVVLGLVLILVGLFALDDAAGVVAAAVGLAPLAAGAFNFCLIAPLLRAPFWGRDARVGS